MKANDQYYLSSFKRVQAFLDENAGQVGGLMDSKGRRLLDEAIAQLERDGHTQSTARLEIDGHANLQQALQLALKKEHMLPIASFARAKLRGVPDYATLTRSTNRISGPALVRAARAMAAAAAPYAAGMAEYGFPAETLAELEAAADKLEQTIGAKANLRVRRAGSTTGIDEGKKLGNEAVRILNAVVERQFAKDKAFLSAWRAAKRVAAKPGAPRGSSTAQGLKSAV